MKKHPGTDSRGFLLALLLVVGLALITTPTLASKETAAKTYFLFGIGQGSSDFKDPALFTGMVDDSDTLWWLGAGFPICRFSAAEVEYTDMGTTEFDGMFTFMGSPFPDEGEIETSGPVASFLGIWPVSERVSLFGRAGAFFFDVEENELFNGFPERHTASGTSPLFGVGVEIKTKSRVAIRVEARRYMDVGEVGETGEGDIDSYTAGLVIRLKKN